VNTIKSIGTPKCSRPNQSEKHLETTKSLKSKASSGSTGIEKFQHKVMKNVELMRGAILLENQMKLIVNFNNDVFDIIREVIVIITKSLNN
jgi:hypothetical protein